MRVHVFVWPMLRFVKFIANAVSHWELYFMRLYKRLCNNMPHLSGNAVAAHKIPSLSLDRYLFHKLTKRWANGKQMLTVQCTYMWECENFCTWCWMFSYFYCTRNHFRLSIWLNLKLMVSIMAENDSFCCPNFNTI